LYISKITYYISFHTGPGQQFSKQGVYKFNQANFIMYRIYYYLMEHVMMSSTNAFYTTRGHNKDKIGQLVS